MMIGLAQAQRAYGKKISEDDALRIAHMWSVQKKTLTEIASEFNVHGTSILSVLKLRTKAARSVLEAQPIKKQVTELERFNAKYSVTPSCWIWKASFGSSGYGQFLLNGRLQGAHRVSYLLFVGNIPEGLFVCHKCDNKACVNPNHLWLGTHAENMRDLHDKKLAKVGEKHPMAKLAEKDVISIRNDRRKSTEIAKDFPVTARTIRAIKSNKTWAFAGV